MRKGCPKTALGSNLPLASRSRENREGGWALFQLVCRPIPLHMASWPRSQLCETLSSLILRVERVTSASARSLGPLRPLSCETKALKESERRLSAKRRGLVSYRLGCGATKRHRQAGQSSTPAYGRLVQQCARDRTREKDRAAGEAAHTFVRRGKTERVHRAFGGARRLASRLNRAPHPRDEGMGPIYGETGAGVFGETGTVILSRKCQIATRPPGYPLPCPSSPLPATLRATA